MRYEVITDATPREALEQAVTFFGPGGEGLQLTTQRPDSLIFQGGGGHVAITAKARGQQTVLDLETREWDRSVQKFMARVSRRQHWWKRWRKRRKAVQTLTSELPILDHPPKNGV
jgi:hypothetical protein